MSGATDRPFIEAGLLGRARAHPLSTGRPDARTVVVVDLLPSATSDAIAAPTDRRGRR